MDSFKEPRAPDVVDISSPLPRLVTHVEVAPGPNPHVVYSTFYVDLPPTRPGEQGERHVVDRFIMPIELVSPMRRAMLDSGVRSVEFTLAH